MKTFAILNKISKETMAALILFIVIVFGITLYIQWKLPAWIGRSGEKFVSKKLHHLNSEHYRILNDIMLPSSGNSTATQIDHIVISNYGIFCIETKAYRGWIFGNADQEFWTQIIFHYKKKFYNPLRQNFAHIKAMTDLLGAQRLKKPIIPLVAFPSADRLKISNTNLVGSARDIVRKIESYTEPILSDAERDEIFNLLMQTNITDKKARRLHNREVGNLKKY